jgi:hypothetical protein
VSSSFVRGSDHDLPNVEFDDEVGVSSITASELLLGTHKGSAENRARRTAYVEQVLDL